MMMHPKGTTDRLVILAGGISSRMKKSADPSALGQQAAARAKGMIGVGDQGRPFLDYLLHHAKQGGLRDIVIVIAGNDHLIPEYYGSLNRGNMFHGLTISYAVQKIADGRSKPAGTADAVATALNARTDWHGSSFLVCNSDNLYSIRAFQLLAGYNGPGATIDYDREHLQFPHERIAQFGLTRKDRDGYISAIVEKPDPDELDTFRGPDNTLRVSMNIFRLQYDTALPFLERCPEHPVRKEKELPVAVNAMVQSVHHSLRAIPLSEHVPDLTSMDDVPRLQQYLRTVTMTPDW
jgi:glucose-1-phosphate thymidylyltransferase